MSYNEKELAFINDLRELMKKHDVELYSYDEYGGYEQYCGTSWTISNEKLNLNIDFDGALLRQLENVK